MSCRKVKVRTESGRISSYIKRNAPTFATIFSMYDNGEVPGEVILSGSVGEIIDEEFGAYKTVKETIGRLWSKSDDVYGSLRLIVSTTG